MTGTTAIKKRIAIIGGGPAGLFIFKRLVECNDKALEISIFESKDRLGAGMPYSTEGASDEHVTNVSGNEIPEMVEPISEWISTASPDLLKRFSINEHNYNDLKVLPRLLFGDYLENQFRQLLDLAQENGIVHHIFINTAISDIAINEGHDMVKVVTHNAATHIFDQVIICSGHSWPKEYEGTIPGWFDSPYPPSKLAHQLNFPVAIKGASLTAIDAIRTIARHNGHFETNANGLFSYQLNHDSPDFRIVLHAIDGLLPAIRFHLEDPHLAPKNGLLEGDELQQVMSDNDGFVPLDYLFERNFKNEIRDTHPELYSEIKEMSIEAFVDHIMPMRKHADPFQLFKAEYAEAEKSIQQHRSVYWKEMLAVLSYAMNYPAKHLSAEDMLRLKKTLMPLISVVIAFVPQTSCKELIALYDAGVLSLVAVDKTSKVEPGKNGGAAYTYKAEDGELQTDHYNWFIDAVGQKPLGVKDFPFESLKAGNVISAATLKFCNTGIAQEEIAGGNKDVFQTAINEYYLKVPGLAINDQFQLIDTFGQSNDKIYLMAVPYMSGYNPDYSGLDFCETASEKIVTAILEVSN